MDTEMKPQFLGLETTATVEDVELSENVCLLDGRGCTNNEYKAGYIGRTVAVDVGYGYDAAVANIANEKCELGEDLKLSREKTMQPNKLEKPTIDAVGGVDNHCQLDSRKYSDDGNYMQSNSKNITVKSDILLTPATLNAIAEGISPTPLSGKVMNRAQRTSVSASSSSSPALPSAQPDHDIVTLTEEYLEEHEAPSPEQYKGPKVWRKFVQKWPIISEQLALLVICVLVWMIGSILLPQHAQPHTAIMRISLLIVGAQITGVLVTLVHLPDMLGMLAFGILFTNLGLADFTSIQPFEVFLREMTLINIMLLAGIGLDAAAFAKLWLMIMRLALMPTIAEVLVITGTAYYLLDMPWIWGLLLGLVITAVSPNVVVSVLLELKKKRLGLNNGIHTLIYGLTACNNVLAVFVFGIVLEVIFSTSDLKGKILQGPVGLGIGVVYGYLYGLGLQFIPSKNAHYVNGLRFVLTLLGGVLAIMGSRAIGYTSAGALACVTVTFFARMGWKREQRAQELNETLNKKFTTINNHNFSVGNRLDLLWKFLKPVSFALIGKEIKFSVLDGKVVGYGVLLVLLGTLFRLCFAYLSTYGGNLSRKERAYITISGFPKATVQAALGPIALNLARSLEADAQQVTLAANVLIISVLAILLTAPLGAIFMTRLAPYWLVLSSSSHVEDVEQHNDDNNAEHTDNHNDGYGGGMMNDQHNYNQHTNKSQNAVMTTMTTTNAINVGGVDV